ncbi:MAG: AI-2E family transporter, partial [Gammaproteobacteria bacterium]|nr:AI-2E family transporter [Gammaproteobacteria bacterium]
PFYQERLTLMFSAALAWLESLGVVLSRDLLIENFNPGTAFTLAGNALAGLGAALSNSFLILLTVIFMLAEANSFPRKLRDVLSQPEQSMPHFVRFAENVNRYMAIKTTVSMATGLVVALMLAALGIDFPLLWGILAFMLNFVPTIGSIIAAVPAVLLALVELGPLPALLAGSGYVALNILFGNFIEPRFMGRGLGLSTLVVFLSLVLWGWVFGPVGMLLSVPLTMTAKIALEANPATEWLARLLGPATGLAKADAEQPDPAAQT